MTVYDSGPVNIEQGNTAYFTVQYQSSTGEITVPSSADVTVSYTNTSNASVTDSVSLTLNDSFFTGTWSSTSAALGLATWEATMAGSTSVQASGQLRILQRQSTY